MKKEKKKPQINPESKAENTTIKEIEPKKKKRGRYVLLYLAIIGFAFYAVITIVNQNIQIADKRAELDEIWIKLKATQATSLKNTLRK